MHLKELKSCLFMVVVNALIHNAKAMDNDKSPNKAQPNYADSHYDENGEAWGIDTPTPF